MIAKAKICAMLAVALFGVAAGLAWGPAVNTGANPQSPARPLGTPQSALDSSNVSFIAVNQSQYSYNVYDQNVSGNIIAMYYGASGTILAQYMDANGSGIDPYSDPAFNPIFYMSPNDNITINMTVLGMSFVTIPLAYSGAMGIYVLPLPYVLPVGAYNATLQFSNPYFGLNGAAPAVKNFLITVLPCPDAIVLNNVTQNGTKLTQNPQGDFTTIDNASTITVTCTVTNALNGTALADEPVLTNSTAGNVTVTGSDGVCSISLNPADLAVNASNGLLVWVSDAFYAGSLTFTVYVTGVPPSPPPPFDWVLWGSVVAAAAVAIVVIWLLLRKHWPKRSW